MARQTQRGWIQLSDLRRAQVLLLLPCNAAAYVGNYFRAEVYRESGRNTWREADALLRGLRAEGRVAFAAVDSSILETQPDDPEAPSSWKPKWTGPETPRSGTGVHRNVFGQAVAPGS